MTDTPTDPAYVVHRRAGGYTAMPNSAVTDERLSFRARGLLAYMLSRPPGWRFSAERIQAESPTEGRQAVAAGLRELSAAGYYRTERVKGSDGRFGMVTHVAESPDLLPPTGRRLPASGYRTPVEQRPKSLLRGTTENKKNRGAVGSEK